MKALGVIRGIVFGRCGLAGLMLTGAALLALSAAEAAAPASIERELQLRAPKLLESCRAKGYKNIGVLKFRVKVGDGPITDSIGTLNSALATRLEIALILANDVNNQIGIVRDANTVLAGDKLANHLNLEGQKRLFAHEYPLAWGKTSVVPDVFFSGLVKFSADMRDMSVQLCAIANDGKGIFRCMEEFKATPSTLTLTETGGSFLRSIGGKQKDEAADQHRERVEKGKQEILTKQAEVKKGVDRQGQPVLNPVKDPAAHVALEVYYDGQLMPYEIVGNEARIPEPQQGQQVHFILKRLSKDASRVGVVLKVNGENSLFRQKDADQFCSKWLLDPDNAVKIIGFKLDERRTDPFVVLGQLESKSQEVNYGNNVGLITLTVFKGKPNIRGGLGVNPAAPPGTAAPAPTPPGKEPPKTEVKKADPALPPPTPEPEKKKDTPTPAPAGSPTPPSDLPTFEPAPGSEPESAAPLRSIRRGAYPEDLAKRPESLSQLKYELRNGINIALRGLVVGGGGAVEDHIQFVDFDPDPEVVMTLAIRYYKGK